MRNVKDKTSFSSMVYCCFSCFFLHKHKHIFLPSAQNLLHTHFNTLEYALLSLGNLTRLSPCLVADSSALQGIVNRHLSR